MARDYISLLNEYTEKVLSGEIITCKAFLHAVKRHVSDLERAESGDTRFRFDADKAVKVCKFIELLPHTKGKWAQKGELITLSTFQIFIVCVLFGWLNTDTGYRRFTIAYIKLPRKNGKSLLAAAIGLYMLCADGEFGAEVYSGATTEKQAWEVFKPAQIIAKGHTALREFFSLDVWAKSIQKTDDGGIFEPIIGKPGDGASPHCAITDEFHEHDTSEQIDTMVTGMGARAQPLSIRITTAGYNIAGPCYDDELYAKKVLDGTLTDDSFFAAIFEADLDNPEDWMNPKAYIQANPNLDISVNRAFLDQRLQESLNNPSYQTRFKTKHLNLWCSAKNAWLNMLDYRACPADAVTNWPAHATKKILILDLASRTDICFLGAMTAVMIDRQWHYYLKGRCYLPEKAIDESPETSTTYRAWRAAGHLIQHDGVEIIFDDIRDDAEQLINEHVIGEVIFDPWRATHLVQTLDNLSIDLVEYAQTVRTMSLPMKELEAAIKSKRFHHDDNPAVMWMFSNIVAKADAKDNIYPRKEKAHFKIDAGVCAIMGVGRLMPKIDDSTINPPDDWQPSFM